MTVFVMFLGRTESFHSDPGPPYQCSFSEIRGRCSQTAYSLNYDGQKDVEHDVNSLLSCSLSGHKSNKFCATFKSLTISWEGNGYYLANSRSNIYGELINLLFRVG